MIDTELKKKMAAFIKENLTGGSMSEEDIIWIMDECDKGNKPTYDDFVKARRQPKENKKYETHLCKDCKFAENPVFEEPCSSCFNWNQGNFYHNNWEPKIEKKESDDIHCKNCKHWLLTLADDPCKNCIKLDRDQPSGLKYTYFEKKDIVDARDHSMDFGPNMMRQEEFKIPDSIKMIIDQNMKPSIVFPQLDGLKEDIKTYHDDTEKYLTGFSGWLTRIETKVNTIKQFQISHDKVSLSKLDNIEKKIDRLTEALESVNSKLDILDQRMHDFRQHQILKDMKCVTQVKDIKEISSAKEPPKFKVGDIVKVTNDSKNKDFFVCRIKWSDHSKQWNYLISLDLEDISGAFWRMEKWLTKSEDYIEPLFKVGDKVKLKHGKVVYDVYSITYFICNKKKVYRYKIGHKATTPHYENENRLVKA